MKSITISIQMFDDPDLPEKYLASIKERPGMVVAGESISEVIDEIRISIKVWEEYNKSSILV